MTKTNWETEFYLIESAHIIEERKKSIETSAELFEKYGPIIKAMDETVYSWMVSGYRDHKFYDEMDIEQHGMLMDDILYRRNVRSEAAKKAAATRKLNKSKSFGE
jgi:hypothetical protein